MAAALLGLGFGASAFFFGFYEFATWAPLALAWLAVLFGLAISAPSLPKGPAAVALAGSVGLAAWSLLSVLWAESADQALLAGDRWLLYAACLAALLLICARRRLERELLAGAVAGVIAVAIYLLGRMLFGDGSEVFVVNRLNEPLDYVNGMAGYLLVAFWPLVAVAERARPALAGAAISASAALASLTVLTQSRGAIAALLLSAVLLCIVVPGRIARVGALLVVAVSVAAASPFLSDVIASLPDGATGPANGDIRAAAVAILVSSALAGLGWFGLRLAAASPAVGGRVPQRTVAVVLAGAGALAVAVALYPPGERVDQVGDQYDAFTELEAVDREERFSSGGGNRYDYWRVAVKQFEDDPLKGVGAGNYDTTYFTERRTTEDIRQAHSVELQALGETGVIGGLFLLAFAGGVFWGFGRMAQGEGGDPALAVAAGGAFSVWLAQTSADWLHLIPGLTGIALIAAVVLLAPSMTPVAAAGRRKVAVAVAGAAAVTVAVVLLAVPYLADRSLRDGQERIASDPAAALESARDSLAMNDESLPAYYLEASALAALGDGEAARASLLEAADREPSDFVTYALLGDLEVRRGDLAAARRAYSRALRLNPRDPSLQDLVDDPRSALTPADAS